MIEDELETVPLCLILSISVRNLGFLGMREFQEVRTIAF
jgi:hypothetical protein